MALLAIMGRGFQRDPECGHYHSTEDLEVTDENFGHLLVRVPVDDNSPYCIMGGGALNRLAGEILYFTNDRYDLVAAGYGDRSPAQIEADTPTNSEVVSREFRNAYPSAPISVWTRDMQAPCRRYNTHQELLNFCALAIMNDVTEIDLVVITVHLPRTSIFMQDHLRRPEYSHLKIHFFAAEQVLLAYNPKLYAERITSIFSSQAFRRTALLEANGIRAFFSGQYKLDPVAAASK